MTYSDTTYPARRPAARRDGAVRLIQSHILGLRALICSFLIAVMVFWPHHMMLHAQEDQQEWLPEVLELPADMEVITDRSIGSSLRMFSFTTERDPDELLEEWEEELRLAGYAIDQEQGDILDKVVEFSGSGISNGKIVIAPVEDDGRAVIEFDATLE
ncbi:hypothetical protein [Loktanella sp. SALINAS62]|uniref:hypothetical protein n=1 Tax=Loktanella sp. SALINAS62 TaxID=2706124 RepID=UPI001B8D6075|nr:hypothetical protein [Loktanella sp. SALINAS62]MBS1302244.1 hypothetical protein [Loktanella sp. SALINAS62]